MSKSILPRRPRGHKDGPRRASRDPEPNTNLLVDIADVPGIDVADLPVDILSKRLHGLRGSRPNLMACCPAHRDSKPSLAVTELPDGTALLYCHARCPIEKILDALGLKFCHLYPSPYARQFNTRATELVSAAPGKPIGPIDEPVIDHERFRRIIRAARAGLGNKLLRLAGDLRVTADALCRLRVGVDDGLAVFPERDDRRRPVGVCYRSRGGERRFETGGKRGLTIPFEQPTANGPLFIAEGATDTAALLAGGARAIGRPAAKPSRLATLWLVRYLERQAPSSVVVLGDNDDPDSGEGVGEVSARELATTLARELGRPVMWGVPRRGFKDVREQFAAGEWSRGVRMREVRA